MNKPLDSTEIAAKKQDQRIAKVPEVDVMALIRAIWDHRRVVFYSVTIVLVFGLIIAVFSPVKYKSSAIILPHAEGKTDLGGLGGLASMAGINLGSMMGNATGIQPDIYPKLIYSYPFLNELVHQPFKYQNYSQPISIYEKQMTDTVPGFGATLKKYTIRLPWTIKKIISPGEEQNISEIDDAALFDIPRLSIEETMIIGSISNAINVDVDSENGLVYISAEMGEPLLAAQVTRKTVELLQKYIVQYKTRQARENFEFIDDRYLEKKREFEMARNAFFNFRDRNQNVIEERTDVRYQELNDSYNIASEVYQTLAKQREQAQISVKKDTPAFSIIEPVKVANYRSAPRRMMIIFVFGILGGFLGIGIVMGQMILGKIEKPW